MGEQAIGVVYPGAPLAHRAGGVAAVEEHGGERRDAQLFDVVADEQPGFHVHHRRVADAHVELVGAGEAAAVEQGVNGHGFRLGGGPHQPELGERRELLPGRQAGVHGDAPGGQTEMVVRPDGAEITGAGEHQKRIAALFAVQRIGELETGVAQIGGHPTCQLLAGVVEIGFIVGHVVDAFRVHLVQLHRVLEVQPRRHQPHLEARAALVPKGAFRLEADALVLLVVEFLQEGRDRRRRLVGLAGPLLGPVDDVLKTEPLGRQRPADQRQNQRRPATKTLHVLPPLEQSNAKSARHRGATVQGCSVTSYTVDNRLALVSTG